MTLPPAASAPSHSVSEMMTTEVHVVRPDMRVHQAIELLLFHRISGAPVVDTVGNVISVVSEGDLLRLAATDGLDATIASCMPRLVPREKVITVQPQQTFVEVYKLFLKHGLHRLIVTDANGRVRGLVSRADMLRLFIEARYGRKITRPAN